MLRYHLAIDNKKYGYKDVDLKKLKISSLQQLDKYTTSFSSQDLLIANLYDKDLISNLDLSKNLIIYYNSKGTSKLLDHGVALSEDKKYLNPDYLEDFLFNNATDLKFLRSLCKKYKDIYFVDIINELRSYIYEAEHGVDDELAELYKQIIKAFYRNQACERDKQTGDYLIYYRGFRDLAMFISDYYKKQQSPEPPRKKEIYEQVTLFGYQKRKDFY